MTTNYDLIAEDYQKSNDHPIKQYIESFTVLKQLGDLQAKSVLDLACGDGYYTRLIKQQGAAQVVGVDISPVMIGQARAIEATAPLGIEYRVCDVTELGQVGRFDLATAVYLFPYAVGKASLTSMFQTISDNLTPGGRLVSITLNPHLSPENARLYRQHGIDMVTAGALQDRSTVVFSVGKPGEPEHRVELSTTFWSQATYETIARSAGFQRWAWHGLHLSPEGREKYGERHWQDFLNKPYGLVLECQR